MPAPLDTLDTLDTQPRAADARAHARAVFFLVPSAREQLPVWVFVPQDGQAGQAGQPGLILDISPAGLQVLSSAAEPLQAPRYRIELLLGEGEGVARFHANARVVWRSSLSTLGDLSGLAFETENSDVAQFLATYAPSVTARRWVRCWLSPL